MRFDFGYMINLTGDLISQIPVNYFAAHNSGKRSISMAKARIDKTSLQAAIISAGLAIPPGVLGYVTLVPNLLGVWKLQRNLVLELAKMYGNDTSTTRNQLLGCLIRHSTAQIVKDLFCNNSKPKFSRIFLKRGTEQLLKGVGSGVIKPGGLFQRSIPVLGSVLAGVYAYIDTQKVGRAALRQIRGR